MPKANSRPYVGYRAGQQTAFRSVTVPTQSSHGKQFDYCTGPFRTMRAARFAAQHKGAFWSTIAEIERLAKREEEFNAACESDARAIAQGWDLGQNDV